MAKAAKPKVVAQPLLQGKHIKYEYLLDGIRVSKEFERTGRSLGETRNYWRSQRVDLLEPKNIAGQKVLDFATGEGRMVVELEAEAKLRGDSAFVERGMDGHLTYDQKTGKNKELFIEEDGVIDENPYFNSYYTLIHCGEGPLSYLSYANPEESPLLDEILTRLHRLARSKGKIMFNVSWGDRYAMFARLYQDKRFKVLVPDKTLENMRTGNGLDPGFVLEVIK